VAPGLETEIMEAPMDPEAIWSQAVFACNRIARLLPVADVIRAETPSSASSHRLLDIMKSMEAEDTKSVAWIAAHTQTSLQHGTSLSSEYVRESLLATGYVHVYRAARIILLQTLFALTIKVTFHSDLSNKFKRWSCPKAQAEYNIQDMVNDISLSVSEVLENLEEESWNKRKSQDDKATAGYVCLWPLNIAFSVKTLGDEQRGDISSN